MFEVIERRHHGQRHEETVLLHSQRMKLMAAATSDERFTIIAPAGERQQSS